MVIEENCVYETIDGHCTAAIFLTQNITKCNREALYCKKYNKNFAKDAVTGKIKDMYQ